MEFQKHTSSTGEGRELESLHSAEGDLKDMESALADPVAYLKSHNLKVNPDSHVEVTVKRRSGPTTAFIRAQRVIIIIAHWSNCDTDIIIVVFSRTAA